MRRLKVDVSDGRIRVYLEVWRVVINFSIGYSDRPRKLPPGAPARKRLR